MTKLRKAEIKQRIRDGRLTPLSPEATIDLERIQRETSREPAFHTFKGKMYQEVESPKMIGRETRAIENQFFERGFDGVADRLRKTLMPTADEKVESTIDEIYPQMMALEDNDTRRRVMLGAMEKVERADRAKRHAEAKSQHEDAKSVLRAKNNLEAARNRLEALQCIKRLCERPILQRLGETGFHKCREALDAGSIILTGVSEEADVEITDHDLRAVHSFVVQHDWAGAFSKATDFEGGEYRMPYDATIYEFRVSGARICFSVSAKDGHPETAGMYVETPVGWALAQFCRFDHGHWCPQYAKLGAELVALCGAQIRAISIALGAKVAETEIVRAPHKLNLKRERHGKLPILDYHIINLAHRVRYTRRLPEAGDVEVEHARRRLHFVRGHDRHYPNHKVWIEWHFRGDPDLGFIDKEYRL